MSRGIKTIALVLGGGLGIAYLAPKFFNPTKTPAVKSIEERYTSAGATPHAERGYATTRGDKESVYTEAETANQSKLREVKADLLGGNQAAPKGNNKVVARADKSERPGS